MPTVTDPNRHHFTMLDAMRGTAALGVVCLHLHALLAPFGAPHGYLAVDFFFGLSGLVISRAYAARLQRGLSVVAFMRMRLERLYPLYLLGSVIGAAALVLPLIRHPALAPPGLTIVSAGVSALLMLPSPLSPGDRLWLMPLNIAAWSLVLELAVNLLFALIWRQLAGALLAVLIAGSGVVLVVVVMRQGNIDLGATWPTLPGGLVRTVFSFLCGVAIGRWVRTAPRTSNWSLGLPVMLFATLLPGPGFGAAYDLVCAIVIYPALLYLGARYQSAHVAVLRFLGNISYPLYALHSGIAFVAVGLAMRLAGHSDAARLGLGIALIGGLIAVAACADAWFDRPLRACLARRRFARSRAAPAKPAPCPAPPLPTS